ncbi:MAG: 2-phosphosulfolactate phosphatase [Bacteroidota bacterium]
MSNSIDVFSAARSFQEEDLRGKTAVIIDVLRATSTITTAIQHGAKGVIAVEDMSDASKIAQNLDPSRYLLCGEKDGVKIDGYHLGNSPLEYTEDAVKGKTLIINTTNGTKAISRSAMASHVYIGSFLNLSAVVDQLKDTEEEIVLVCAGWRNRLSLEDMLCAGQIIHELHNGKLPEQARDGARVAHCLYEKYGPEMPEVIQESNHAVRLKGIVDGNDIDFCSQVDKFDIVPTLEDGIIT